MSATNERYRMDPAYRNEPLPLEWPQPLVWVDVCSYCDKFIEGVPYQDPEWLSWVGVEATATFCDVFCFDCQSDQEDGT